MKMAEMRQYSFKFKYRRFSDAVFALAPLSYCDEVYVEDVSIKESLRISCGMREKYYLLTFTMRTRLDLENTRLMKLVKDRAMKD